MTLGASEIIRAGILGNSTCRPIASVYVTVSDVETLRGVILLLDDVCTTGATLEAGAHALREAGAQAVFALTVARAASPFTA